MSAIKEKASIPLVTKLADADKLLGTEAYEMLKKETNINNIYQSTLALKSKRSMENEYSTPIVIL